MVRSLFLLLVLYPFLVLATPVKSSASSQQQQQQGQQKQQKHQLLRRSRIIDSTNSNSNSAATATDTATATDITEELQQQRVLRERLGSGGGGVGNRERLNSGGGRVGSSAGGGDGGGDGGEDKEISSSSNNNNNSNNGVGPRYTTSASCTPVTVLDSIPFLYTKSMYISYDFVVGGFLDFRETNNGNGNGNGNNIVVEEEPLLLLQKALEDSFIQAYNEVVTDCPIFTDTTDESSSSSSSPTRQLDDAYFLFGYDQQQQQQQQQSNTNANTPDFTTSFFLMSLDLKCSYCQQRRVANNSNNNNNNNNDYDEAACSIPMFDDEQNPLLLSSMDPSCSCGVPSTDDFLEDYENRINDYLSSLSSSSSTPGGTTMKIVLKQISEIQVEPIAGDDTDTAAVAGDNLDKDIINNDNDNNNNNNIQLLSSPLSLSLGWEIPIEVSATTVGCRPSAFVLVDVDNEQDNNMEDEQTATTTTTTTSSSIKKTRTVSGTCEHLSISGGVPTCGRR